MASKKFWSDAEILEIVHFYFAPPGEAESVSQAIKSAFDSEKYEGKWKSIRWRLSNTAHLLREHNLDLEKELHVRDEFKAAKRCSAAHRRVFYEFMKAEKDGKVKQYAEYWDRRK